MDTDLDAVASLVKETALIPLNARGCYECVDANLFLDRLCSLGEARTDSELCRRLNVGPPVISKIRHGRATSVPIF